MPVLDKSKQLEKRLGLLSVFAIATGTTLSSGLFLLPGLAARQAGPAVVLSYVIASIPLIPAMLSVVELSTATPRAGGAYYFLDRSMGPAVGTVGGIGTWLALVLKTAFALLGMGAYLGLFIDDLPIMSLAIGLAVTFGVLNLLGAKATGNLQIVLVLGVLLSLAWFVGFGLPAVDRANFENFWSKGADGILKTSAMVYISYVGVTKVASVAEEVKNPERTLPLGVFLAVATTIAVYIAGIVVMVGVIPAAELHGSLTPVADAASRFAGRAGTFVVAITAILAFSSVANAGILSASRYPLAMSRDHLMPRFLGKQGKDTIPRTAVLVTMAVVIGILLMFDPTRIAKLAGAFQLLMFAGICGAVLVMRESGIESYDPSFRSPLYPYTQIAGILSALFLLGQMGWQSQVFTFGLVSLCLVWYYAYARRRVDRAGAVSHVFARLGQARSEDLDIELRSILKEKGVRPHDPFEEIVTRARVLDIDHEVSFEEVSDLAAGELVGLVPEGREFLKNQFLEGTRIGATPVSGGVALPHCRHRDLEHPEMVVARVRKGVTVPIVEPGLGLHAPEEPIFAIIFLASPEHDPAQHLRLLAQVARCAEDEKFMRGWLAAKNELELRVLLLREERMLQTELDDQSPLSHWIGKSPSEVGLPPGVLIALVRRGNDVLVPGGATRLERDDCLTFIGDPSALAELGIRRSAP